MEGAIEVQLGGKDLVGMLAQVVDLYFEAWNRGDLRGMLLRVNRSSGMMI